MANYANAKATIAANIYTNHTGQVTAEMVKTAANSIVDTLIAGGYLYAGVAKLTPTQTNPGSPDANVFYIATEPGTYTNFGSLVVADGEVAIFKWNGTWSKEVTGAATAAQVTELGQALIRYVNLAPYDTLVNVYPRNNGRLQSLNGYVTIAYNVTGLDCIYISGQCRGSANISLVMFVSSYDPLSVTGIVQQPSETALLKNYPVPVPDGSVYALVLLSGGENDYFTPAKGDGYIYVEDALKKLYVEEVAPVQNALLKGEEMAEVATMENVYPRNNNTLSSLPGAVTKVYDVTGLSRVLITGKCDPEGPSFDNAALVMFVSSYDPLSVISTIHQPQPDQNLYNYAVNVPDAAGTIYALVYVSLGGKSRVALTKADGYYNISEELAKINALDVVINCVGDSITQGQKGIINLRDGTVSTSRNSYTKELQDLLGSDFDIKNYGYGGNAPADILTAVGLESIKLTQQVTLKADGTPSAINDISDPVDSASGEIVSAYLTQFATTEAENAQTYCEVFGIPCKISRSNDTMFIARREAGGADFIIPSGTNVYMDGVQDKDAIYVIYVGRNNLTFYAQTQNFVKYLRTIVSAISSGRYIVIGEKASLDEDPAIITPTNNALEEEFGPRFVNLQKELCNYAIFERLGYTPTEDSFFTADQLSHGVISDVSALSRGLLPVSFWRQVYGVGDYTSNDKVHLSRLGYHALALLVSDRLAQLGWI